MSGSVGPGRPPRERRFREGTSGNPKGRPKSAGGSGKGVSAFDIIIAKTLTLMNNGVPRDVTVEEALQHRTYQDAIAGNRSARREILKMIAKRERWLAARQVHNPEPFELRIEPVDPDNANAAMLILGIACHDPKWKELDTGYERRLLEPWAVQAALSRRRGGRRLSEKDILEIKRCTRDPETLRWPRSAGK